MPYFLRIFALNLNDLKIMNTWMLKHSKAKQKVDSSFAYLIIRTIDAFNCCQNKQNLEKKC